MVDLISGSNSEKINGRIYAVNQIDLFKAFDFLNQRKKDAYLDRLQKKPIKRATFICSNPSPDLFQLWIRYLILIGPTTPTLEYLVDSTTSNKFLEDFKNPALLKNLKSFPANDFFFFCFIEEYEIGARVVFLYSKIQDPKTPAIQIICDLHSNFFLQLDAAIHHWYEILPTLKVNPANPSPTILVHIDSKLLDLLKELFAFYAFQWPNPTQGVSIDKVIHQFRDAQNLFPPTTTVEVKWLKTEEQVPIKSGAKSGTSVPARKFIYFDTLTNEIGSAFIFKDKHCLLKILQVDNLLDVPFIEKEGRRFLDLVDPTKIKLLSGYASLKLKIVKKELVNHQIMLTFQDMDSSSSTLITKSIFSDPNNLKEGEIWLIKGTGLRKTCNEIVPRFEWKGMRL